MQKPIISAIAAIGKNNKVLGKNNSLLWNIPEDMTHFRETTKGHAVIMGRKTFKSIGKPLPNRLNIVITRDPGFKADGVEVAHSFEEAYEIAQKTESEEIFNIGGAEIYRLGLPVTDRLYLTLVDTDKEGDAYFPGYEDKFTNVISRKKSSNGEYDYEFVVLEK